MNIRLPVAFSNHHERVVRKHLAGVERLTGADWRLLIEAMDSLRRAEIVKAGQRRMAWLTPAFWSLLDGEPTPVAYNSIWQVLPNVAQITLRGRHFVIVPYDEWKQRLIARQRKGID